MFNFSANNLTLLSRTECKSCVVFVMKDLHTKRVYRLYDFTKAQTDHVRPVYGACRARSTAPTSCIW